MTPRKLSFLLLVAGVPAALALARAAGPALFSHKMHLEDVGAECATCHELGGSGRPTLKKDACADCHEKGAPAYRTPGPAPRPLSIHFGHARHAKAMPDCKACHAAAIADRPERRLGVKDCVRCHQEKKAAVPETACARCHGANQRQVEPPDHRPGWLRRHGTEARWRVRPEHGKECALCHGEATCTRCHDQMTPRSHTGLFRVRTHGRLASWDRDSCRTCHGTGTCVRCHRTTPPVNHRGNWLVLHGRVAGGLDNERCATCHNQGFCNRCHGAR